MFSIPEAAPNPVGEKLTAIVHDAPPPASVEPQVVPAPSTANTAGLVVMLLKVIVPPGMAALLLVTVMNLSGLVVMCGTVPNWTVAGTSTSDASVPFPCIAIETGLFLVLLTMVRDPMRVPCAVGLKLAVTMQLLFAGRTPVHPSVTIPKSPDGVTLEMVSATELELVRVAVLVALVDPTNVVGNTMVVETPSSPWTPVPLSVTICGLLGASEGMLTVPV
jgi:hypothetical protein